MRLLALLLALTQFDETITVSRSLVAVRVLDVGNKNVPGLQASDFAATIDGRPAPVLTARWVEESNDSLPEKPQGRLFVLFIQTDFTRASRRVSGQMSFRTYAEDMLRSLEPNDRVAVFSFDSHLKFRRDFTTPENAVPAIAESLRIDFPEAPEPDGEPSLTPLLDRNEMKRAASSDAALLVLANALAEIEGPKTMIFIGWGLDSQSIATITRQWPDAVMQLQRADVTIMGFNYAPGAGSRRLAQTARETGGFVADASNFPRQSVNRFESAMSGYYELELRVPDGTPRGEHALQVRVPGRNVSVRAPGTLFTN